MIISATLSVKAITDVLAVETGQWLSELGLVHGVNNRQLWRGELTYEGTTQNSVNHFVKAS